MTPEFIAGIVRLVNKAADDIQNNAGWSGEHGDRGAAALRQRADYWHMGCMGKIPAEFKKYEVQVNREADPEYKEYLRLKEKFGL